MVHFRALRWYILVDKIIPVLVSNYNRRNYFWLNSHWVMIHIIFMLEVSGNLGAGFAVEALRFLFGERVQYVLWQAGAGVMYCMIACSTLDNLFAP